MSSQYFTAEEIEEHYKKNRIHDRQVEYTDATFTNECQAILTTRDGRHYKVYYCEKLSMSGAHPCFKGQECEELFLIPKLTLELGYSSTPEPETRISDDIMKADRGELVEMLENTEEELVGCAAPHRHSAGRQRHH